MKIGVVGSSGFVGKELIEALKGTPFEVLGLSRRSENIDNWKFLDLYSKKIAISSLSGFDIVIYLAHAISPREDKVKANFRDLDLLLVDNLIHACIEAKTKKIIYLSAIIPEDEKLSTHLESRLEVENVIKNSGIDYTIIRSGIIIGKNSFAINFLKNYILKMPFMLIPPQVNNQVQLINIDMVILKIKEAINNYSKMTINLGYKPITYKQLILDMAKFLNKKIILIKIPFFPIKLSSFLASKITKINHNLITSLFYSLKNNLVSKDFVAGSHDLSILDKAMYKYKHFSLVKRVRYVKRVNCNFPAHWLIYQQYYNWLLHRSFFIGIKVKGPKLIFYILIPYIKLLELEYYPQHSSLNRELLFVTGGLLSGKPDYARLEFRRINNKTIIVALHDFNPRLPWFIYKHTQGRLHSYIMIKFKYYLENTFRS